MKKKGKTRASREMGKKTSVLPDKTPMQGIWSGTVSFSLVAIPVILVRAVEPGHISFHLLHNKDYSPLQRKMFCPQDEKIVLPKDIVRGYEIEPGKHVVVSEDELESVSPDRSRTIEIQEFIDLGDVDPLYYDHPYFLAPSKGGEKSYRLLAEAMRRMNRAGVAKFVLDEREYLVVIMNRDGALAISTLHYSDEILPAGDWAKATHDASNGEISVVKKIMKDMITGFAPEKYSNDRREKLLSLIKKKEKAKAKVEAPEVEEEETSEGTADLMSALEESMRRMKST
jgi:DNA end-binding protein Ku